MADDDHNESDFSEEDIDDMLKGEDSEDEGKDMDLADGDEEEGDDSEAEDEIELKMLRLEKRMAPRTDAIYNHVCILFCYTSDRFERSRTHK